MTAQLCAYFRKDLAHHFQCRKTLLHNPKEKNKIAGLKEVYTGGRSTVI